MSTNLCKNNQSMLKSLIKTCVGCTSPTSRRILHEENAFKRYEFQFLNMILYGLANEYSIRDKYIVDLNRKNKSNNKRYDLMITSTVGNHEKPVTINVEIDEKQHLTTKQSKQDRPKEKNFQKIHGENSYIFRIVVGEDTKTNCVDKKNGKCSVTDKQRFDKNMKSVIQHIVNLLNLKDKCKACFIDFSTSNGIVDITQPQSEFPEAVHLLMKNLRL
jgi:hypothetical protein